LGEGLFATGGVEGEGGRIVKELEKCLPLIESFKGLEWFHATGTSVASESSRISVIQVFNWDDVSLHLREPSTEKFFVESRNSLFREKDDGLKGRAPPKALHNTYSLFSKRLRSKVLETTDSIRSCIPLDDEAAKLLADYTQWIVAMACVVQEYEEIIRVQRTYTDLAKLLLDGHCVAGWSGDYPDGNLVVF
jgi:hypothetical protein